MSNKPTKLKPLHIGAPAVFALDMAVRPVVEAFDSYGCFLVGSALKSPDWRDIDLRLIMGDDEFQTLFPDALLDGAAWELDSRWLLMTTAISEYLGKVTGLPIDFQFQPQSHANAKHPGNRHPFGVRLDESSQRKKSDDC